MDGGNTDFTEAKSATGNLEPISGLANITSLEYSAVMRTNTDIVISPVCGQPQARALGLLILSLQLLP
ncbi:MAG TPA: hypothetical protein VGL10_00280 [Gammaproteobacteria bacterium]